MISDYCRLCNKKLDESIDYIYKYNTFNCSYSCYVCGYKLLFENSIIRESLIFFMLDDIFWAENYLTNKYSKFSNKKGTIIEGDFFLKNEESIKLLLTFS